MNKKYQLFEVDFKNSSQVDEILELLRLTFPHTNYFNKTWWEWKYLGRTHLSPIGWAFRDVISQRIISIRLLWPFRFYYYGKEVTVFQPLDTATHPAYQGQGLFSQLINHSVKVVAEYNSLMFNFPNENSIRGNIKNGWVHIGKIKWYYGILLKNYRVNPRSLLVVEPIKENTRLQVKNYSLLHSELLVDENFIQWRFGQHPLFEYFIVQDENGFLIYRQELKYGLMVTRILLAKGDEKFVKNAVSCLKAKWVNIICYNGFNLTVIQAIRDLAVFCFRSGNANYVIHNLSNMKVSQIQNLEIGFADFI